MKNVFSCERTITFPSFTSTDIYVLFYLPPLSQPNNMYVILSRSSIHVSDLNITITNP